MRKDQQAHDLAAFLAPMVESASGATAGSGAPAGRRAGGPADERLIDQAGPDVDLAIRLELQEVLGNQDGPDPATRNCPKPAPGEAGGAGGAGERLRRLLEGDDHAVGVLWALLAGGDSRPRPDVLQLAAAAAPARGRASHRLGMIAAGGRRIFWSSAGYQRNFANFCMNALVALVLLTSWWLAGPSWQARPQPGALSLAVFAVWSLSFLPGWLYIRFLGQRAGALWDEYVLNLHRLAWDRPRHLPRPPVNSDFYPSWLSDGGDLFAHRPTIYRQKFDAYYGKSVSQAGHGEGSPVRIETLFPIFLTTTTLAVCWTAVLWNPHFASSPASIWDVLRFGFLGAYSFILQMLFRRFFQSDLRPAAYANAMLRIIVVLILVAALYQVLPGDNQRAAAVIAFVIGFFPLVGMQAIQRFAATALRVLVPSLSPAYPLNQIDGLSVWYEARLLEEGIEDMQSLATANFVDVILHTRVPVGRLVDWVDQAHLCMHLDRVENTWQERKYAKRGEPAGSDNGQLSTASGLSAGSVTTASRAGTKTRTALRQFGIRTATDLLKAFPPEYVRPGALLAPGSPWETHLSQAAASGLDRAQLRTMVLVLSSEPSLVPVWNWQKRGVLHHDLSTGIGMPGIVG